jgi:hypothetical protein
LVCSPILPQLRHYSPRRSATFSCWKFFVIQWPCRLSCVCGLFRGCEKIFDKNRRCVSDNFFGVVKPSSSADRHLVKFPSLIGSNFPWGNWDACQTKEGWISWGVSAIINNNNEMKKVKGRTRSMERLDVAATWSLHFLSG